jgi:transposase
MSNHKKGSIYTPEFRASAVKLALESDQAYSQTARELGVTKSTLYTWVHNSRLKGKNQAGNDDDILNELKRLKAENRRLREEREILKKAAAYFAKSLK